MLHQIVLQLAMGICISDFLTHGKKDSKCGGHLVINIRKRILSVIRFRVIRCKRIYNFLCSMLILHQLLYVLSILCGTFMIYLD
jgi:hypothetical protein